MGFDYTQLPASQEECVSFDKLPAGEYNCCITECEEAVSPNGYEFVKLRAAVSEDGPHKGRTMSLTFWTGGKYPESAYKQIGSIMFAACGKGCQLHELVNKIVRLKIRYKDGDEFPKFSGCSRATQQPAVQQPAVQQQPVVQQQPASEAPF